MKRIMQIKIKETGEVGLSKAEYKTGCVLTDGRWLPSQCYIVVRTIYCHYCQNVADDLILVDGPNGKRYCCRNCSKKIPERWTCIHCPRPPKHLLSRVKDGVTAQLHYCYRHWVDSPYYDEATDGYRDYTINSVEKYEECYLALCIKYYDKKDRSSRIPQSELDDCTKLLEKRVVSVPA